MNAKTEAPGLPTPAQPNTCDYNDAPPIVAKGCDVSGPSIPLNTRPQSEDYDVDDVKRTADVAAMLEAVSGPPRSRRYHCPQPEHDDTRPSCATFTGDDGTPLWKCHSCGTSGSAIELGEYLMPALDSRNLINWVGRNYSTAGPKAHGRHRNTPTRPTPPKPQTKPLETRAAEYEKAHRPDNADQILQLACEHRGWSFDIAVSWCCEVVQGHRGVLALRMPYVYNSTVVAWKDRHIHADGRPITSDEADALNVPKHKNPGGKIEVPFGVDRLDPTRFDQPCLFIVEGEADAISMTEAIGMTTPVIAFPGASNINDRWVNAVIAWLDLGGRRVFVVADNDPAGLAMREALTSRVARAKHLYVPQGHNDVSDWLQATTARVVAEQLRAQTRAEGAEVAA